MWYGILIAVVVVLLALWLRAVRFGQVIWRETAERNLLNERKSHAWIFVHHGKSCWIRLTDDQLHEARIRAESNMADLK